MNKFMLAIALRSAKEWAKTDISSFSRYFDLSQADRAWLADASDNEISCLCQLPTSVLQVNFNVTKALPTTDCLTSAPSNAISTISMILTGVADELRANLRVGMLAWGITDAQKAEWLSQTNVEQRIALAVAGEINFSLRVNSKRLKLDSPDATTQMANLMKILSGSSKCH
jgi:hypothetical protein